jgi:hypothetical protein
VDDAAPSDKALLKEPMSVDSESEDEGEDYAHDDDDDDSDWGEDWPNCITGEEEEEE